MSEVDPGPTRRTVLLGSVIVGAGAVALAGCGSSGSSDSDSSDASGGSASESPTTATSPSASDGTKVATTSEVPVGGSKQVTNPATGKPALVMQLSAGSFTALSAVCTHMRCTVAFKNPKLLQCPCHGSAYNPADGAVIHGPAPAPLSTIPVSVSGQDILMG